MPSVENLGAEIYWDELGDGPPVLLIMGLGCASGLWHRTRPALAARFRTIAVDNRGVGKSSRPPGPYPIALMASDAAAVLDAAGAASAHVFGVSMGGMIAQEFALQYPDRVRSLILGCTWAGGPQAPRPKRPATENLSPEEAARVLQELNYHPHTAQERIDEDRAAQGVAHPDAYVAQFQGSRGWESYGRLSRITVPTLVIHGACDLRVPPANATLLAEGIRGAKLVIIPDAGHLFITDQPEAANGAVLGFLEDAALTGSSGN
jgi:3-oxoadipate enol-lactonase